MGSTPLVAAGIALMIAGGAGIGYGVTRAPAGGMTPAASAAMASAIGQLDGDLRAARNGVHERTSTLAQIQQVRAVVAADAATAKNDLEGGELKFVPEPGEVIELGQVRTGKPPEVLLVQPDGGAPTPHAGKPGTYTEMVGDQVMIVEVANVMPLDHAHELTGYVAVGRTFDLAPAIKRLVDAGIAGRFDLAGHTRTIGTPAAGAVEEVMPLPSQADVHVVVAAPPKTGGMPLPVVAGGAGGALLGLVLVVAGIASKRGGAAPAPGAPLDPAVAQTQYSAQYSVAAGTPAPLDPSGAVAVAPSNLAPGAMIGRWEIIKRLGSGGMADVYLARARGEAGFEKLVAVKVMHPHLARNERAVAHFLDEARLAARIAHPNVVAIQDLGKIGNDFVIVMEYVDGVDLERLLMSARAAQRQVPIDVGLGLLCRICDGLNAAHKATAPDGSALHIVHRDVKSANVLVSKQGGVKVVDFGIAKAAQQGHLTVAGETKGTPSMMAPEQRVGEQVDVRADVYSVAAVGFEILTGHGVNLDLAALAHLGIENWPHLPLPTSLRPQLPIELDDILMTAMAFERERRPADCAAFEATFEQVMKRNGLSATDKDIARWVTSELALLPSSADSPAAAPSPAV